MRVATVLFFDPQCIGTPLHQAFIQRCLLLAEKLPNDRHCVVIAA